MNTTYTITDRVAGSTGTTTDAELAEKYARRADYRVTAVSGGQA
mgnify:CR=1 FL=1